MKFLLASLAVTSALASPVAWAQNGPSTVPNGPYGDNDSIASLRTYAQMMKALESSASNSGGAVKLEYAPWTSNTGRKVPYVVIGNGPTAALIIAQQHGDEMETSDSAINMIRTLGNNSMSSKAIRAALTVVVVPRVNVDGFDGENADGTPITDSAGRTTPWRQNYDPRFVVGSLPAFYQRGRGYDINRYHAFRPECPLDNPNYPNITSGVVSCETKDIDSKGPYLVSEGNPVPEAKNIRWINDRYKPVVALDMHHQGTRVHDGQMVTASALYPTAEATAIRLRDTNTDPNAVTRFTAGQTMAKRVVVLIAQTLAQYPYANLSRYPGGTEPGISRNAYGLLGSGSVLLELRGGMGTKSGGYIQKIGYHASMAIVEQLARDPFLNAYDPNLADVLVVPANGIGPNPGPGSEGEDEHDHGG
jgi:hypothetical protein